MASSISVSYRFHGLGIHDSSTRVGIPAQPLTLRVVERHEQHRPSSAQANAAKMIKHRLPGREAARQVAPATARTEDIEDCVEDAADRMTPGSAVALGRMQILLQALPFGTGEIGWERSCSCRGVWLTLAPLGRYSTRS
jgi:hypothetical protein